MIIRDRAFRRWRRLFAGFAGLSLASDAFGKGSGGRQECGDLVNCKYFGCYPKGTECPADCDEYLTPEACHAVKTSSGRKACLFNPQYSGGKGLCQKDVVCFNLGDGECSDNCFRCGKFGCLPDDTDCPAPCSAFNTQISCETLGGVAGGMACQWNRSNGVCAIVPLSQLTRTLSPSPVRPYPAFKIRDGVTITPSAFPRLPTATSTTQPPVGPLTPIGSSSRPKSALDWTSVEGHPERLALFIGGAVAILGLVCVVALLFYRRAKKSRMNKELARGYSENSRAGVGGDISVDVGVRDGVRRRSTLPSPPLPSNSLPISPKTQFHRESLLVHVRKAVGLLKEEPSEPPPPVPQNADGRPEVGGSFLVLQSAAHPWKPSDRSADIDVAAESPLATVVHTNGATVSSYRSDRSSAILTHPFKS